MTNPALGSDPVLDLIVGRHGSRLSVASSVGITFLSSLVLAAVVATGIATGAVAFGGFVLIVVAVAWWSTPLSAMLAALVGFLFANGFAVDAGGTLAWHGQADLLRLACMIALAVTTSLLGYRHVEGRDLKDS